jgi:hypothetical protein
MKTYLGIFLISLSTIHNVWSCSGGGKQDNNAGGVLQRLVGKDVTAGPYDSSGYSGHGGGPITAGSDLNCDFSSSCCWQNSPDSQVQWQLGTGAPESAKMKKNFGTTTLPTGNFLVVPSEAAAGATDQAKFVSCSIPCTTGPITVNLRHWATKGVTIQVCTQADGTTSLQNCQTLPTANPGPDSVTLPQVSSLTDIVIVASGFTAKTGSIAMIDDIQVTASVCPTTTTSTTAATTTTTTTLAPVTTATAQVCTNVQCNFESSSPCAYTDASTTSKIGGANKSWQTVQGRFNNPSTGVPGAGEGTYYTAVYLLPGDAATLISNVNFDQPRVVRFKAYKVVEGVDLQCCCDQIDTCVYKTGKGTQTSDFRVWKTVSVTCPAGTKSVIFYAKNFGRNQGAVGLDNIQVLIPSGTDPNAATQNAC